MPHNPEMHHRRSIRLLHYDYSRSGAYFITICTHEKACLFGEIRDGKMVLNEYGRIVEYELNRTMNIRPNVEIDVYSVMPNHFHGILVINSMVNSRRGVLHNPLQIRHYGRHHKPSGQSYAGSNPPSPNASMPSAIHRALPFGSAIITNILSVMKTKCTKSANT